MKVMCAVMESATRGLVESPCHALNGNQDAPVIEYRHCVSTKKINGLQSYLSPAEFGGKRYNPWNPLYAPAPSSNFDAWVKNWKLYQSQTDAQSYSDPGQTMAYGGSGVITGPGQFAVVSGYPYRVAGTTDPTDPTQPEHAPFFWSYVGLHGERNYNSGQTAPLNVTSPGGFGALLDPDLSTIEITETSAHFHYEHTNQTTGAIDIVEDTTSARSGLVDVAGLADGARAIFTVEYWDHSWPLLGLNQQFGISFRDWALGGPGIMQGDPSHSPGDYDGTKYRQYAGNVGPIGGPGIPGMWAASGWDISTPGIVKMWRGSLHTTDLTTPQWYWAGRFRAGKGWKTAVSGEWVSRVDVTGSGFLKQLDINTAAMINGQDPANMYSYEPPFPSSTNSKMFPLAGMHDGAVLIDLNFVVVGVTPAAWCKRYATALGGGLIGDNFVP